MTKRIFSALLAVVLAVGGCGCAVNASNNYNYSGNIDENRLYTNNLFDFQLQIDYDWVLGTEEDYRGFNVDKLESTSHDDFKKVLDEYNVIVDLIVYTDEDKDENMCLYVYKPSFIQENCDGKSYIDFLYEEYPIKDSIEKTNKQFAGVDCQVLNLNHETIDSYSRYIFFESNEYLGHLSFICDSKERADELTSLFTKAK